ncbi:hypothetical protein [Streptomyces sp. NPDC059761]|uniref:hypothetical protein n=1 Tax=Streptomyces sp. NPDC059761 TaxID=3346937 RepID=UPI003647831A
MATSKLSDTMIRVILEALTRRSVTTDGTVVYQVSCSASTAKALTARGKVETSHKVVRTPGINDGVSYQAVAVWLTEECVAWLREALQVVLGKSGNDRDPAYHDVIRSSRKQSSAVAAFMLGNDVESVEVVGRNRADSGEDFREQLTAGDAVTQLGDIMSNGQRLTFGDDGRITMWTRMTMNVTYTPVRSKHVEVAQAWEERRQQREAEYTTLIRALHAADMDGAVYDVTRHDADGEHACPPQDGKRLALAVGIKHGDGARVKGDADLFVVDWRGVNGGPGEMEFVHRRRTEGGGAPVVEPTPAAVAVPDSQGEAVEPVEGTRYRMFVGVLRDDAKDMGEVSAAQVRTAVMNGWERGNHAQPLGDGVIRVGYSFFEPVADAGERAEVAPEGGQHVFVSSYRQEIRNGAGELEFDALEIEGWQAERIVGHHTTASVSYREGGVIVVTKSPTNIVKERTIVLTPVESRGPVKVSWSDVRAVLATELAVGDVFVQPVEGIAYREGADGSVRGAGLAWEMGLEGTLWTVVGREGAAVTTRNAAGSTLTEDVPESARVLRLMPVEAPVGAVEPVGAPEGPAVAVGTVEAPWEVYGHRVHGTGGSVPMGRADWTVPELQCVDCGRVAHLHVFQLLNCTPVRELAGAQRLAALTLPSAARYEIRLVRGEDAGEATVLGRADAVNLLAARITMGWTLGAWAAGAVRVGSQGIETTFRPLAG